MKKLLLCFIFCSQIIPMHQPSDPVDHIVIENIINDSDSTPSTVNTGYRIAKLKIAAIIAVTSIISTTITTLIATLYKKC